MFKFYVNLKRSWYIDIFVPNKFFAAKITEWTFGTIHKKFPPVIFIADDYLASEYRN